MDSDKALCVRVESGDAKSVQVINLATGAVMHKFPMGAESAILCPDGKSMAVRAGVNLQLFNLELQKKTKSTKLPEDQVPVFWNWVSPTTIGVVTATAVFHLSADGDAAPTKMFDRSANMAGAQIINYSQSVDGQWMMVCGIKPGAAPGAPLEGCLQLYSAEKKVAQPLVGHAGCFATIKPAGRADAALLFCFVKYGGAVPEVTIIEIGRDRAAAGAPFRPTPCPLHQAPEAAAGGDFPVALQASKKHDMLYILTKMGYAFLIDIHSGQAVARLKVSETPVFAAHVHEASGGVLALSTRSGNVNLVHLNEGALVTYVVKQLGKPDLAMALAGRLGLAGADSLYTEEFQRLLSAGDTEGAIRTAVQSPNGILRTTGTIALLQKLPTVEGSPPAILRYFTLLMETGKLNKVESIELARPALQQSKVALVEKWLGDDKLTCSEALGDMIMALNSKLALSVYLRSGEAHEKVVQALLATGDFAKIVPYALKFSYRPNFMFILQQLAHANAKAAEELAKQLVKEPAALGQPALLEIPSIIDVFMQFQRLQEATAFLLDVLAEDKAEQGFLQTKLLELNLLGGAPQVAHAILGSGMFHHFDKKRIAGLCEKSQLFQRALELYTDIGDIKRVLGSSQSLPPEFLVAYFGNLTQENVLECLNELLKNPANEALVVKIATQYSEQLTPTELIKTFEAHKMYNGLFYYLGAIVNSSEDKAVHFKYIVAAANLKQFKEVERVCRDSQVYDPVAVKEFLKDAKLPDPRPLIHVCDRFNFVDDLTSYLWANKLGKFVEVYVQKVAPAKTPAVIGKLLDLDAEEDFIRSLLDSVRMLCPVEALVEEVEKRNRLRLLQPWLEQRVRDGNTDAHTHNALGKIYVTLNKEPQAWLKSNSYYDSKVVGKFCEKLDPFLAYLAYRRGGAACDAELIEVTSRNGLWKDQARYLVERQDLTLWGRVLADDNPHRRDIIDQVTSTALPETKSPEEVSTTVKAFMAAKLPNELIGLLEKLVLGSGNVDFSNNRNLQNLLILTAVKCAHDPGAPEGRAMDYITRLDNYDAKEIAKIALKDEYRLYEEAFTIYKKFEHHLEAMEVLLDKVGEMERAGEYAQRCNKPEVWSALAAAQLAGGHIKDAIDSYIKAANPSAYETVIATSEAAGKFEDLCRFLDMARKTLKERAIDSALVYALAQTHKLGELEAFVTSPNVADIQHVGDRAFEEGLYEAARVIYTAALNFPRLASTLVALGLYREACDAAKKANSVRTWKEVNAACVKAGEFKLAQTAGLHIIVSPDHMEDLIESYESAGHWEELIRLLEQGIALEGAHQGIFTELGVMYSRYRPEALMSHVRANVSRINTSKMLRACEAGRHWQEACFILTETEDFDGACKLMMEHSSVAFAAERFMEIIHRVRNTELYYASLSFFTEEEPALLLRLLTVLMTKVDHSRVVHQFKKSPDALPIILPYLKLAQKENIPAVNEAVNSLLTEEEDVEGLRASIDAHDAFDQVGLAQRLEKHELLELRRIAALLYKKNKRWESSIALSKQDSQFKDAIDTAAESKEQVRGLCGRAGGRAAQLLGVSLLPHSPSPRSARTRTPTHAQALAEALLSFFVSKGDKECFTATLYTCYSLIRPDVALEQAWRARLTDSVMPFMIQYLRHANQRISALEAKLAPKEGEAEAAAAAAAAAAGGSGMPGMGGMGMVSSPCGGQGLRLCPPPPPRFSRASPFSRNLMPHTYFYPCFCADDAGQ